MSAKKPWNTLENGVGPRVPSEKIRLRDEAKRLRKQIRAQRALLTQRQKVEDLRKELEQVTEKVNYPTRYDY